MAIAQRTGSSPGRLETARSRSGLPDTSDWPVAIVASGFLTGVLIARSLADRGVRVILIDCDPRVQAFSSPYGEAVVCPNPDEAPAAWVQFMRDLARKVGARPVLMAASDQFISAIGQHADVLGGYFRISRSAKLQADLAVKDGQLRYAKQFGLPIPNSVFVDTENAVLEFASSARFPVLVKPRHQRFWSAPAGHPVHCRKALVAHDPAELLAKYRLACEFSRQAIIQEMIDAPDKDKRVHVAIYRNDGDRVAHLTLRELRCTHLGLPTVCEPVEDPAITQICDQFLRATGYLGTCELELIWDSTDNTPKVLDINPRFSGSGDAVHYAGIDQAWLVYLDLIGHPVEAVTPTTLDFRHVMLANDAAALRQYWRDGRLTWKDLLASYRRPVHFWDLDRRNWRLSLATLATCLRTLMATLIGRTRPRRH